MPEYLVTWEINVSANDHIEAARIAREWQLDPDSAATVFTVERLSDFMMRLLPPEVHEVDLDTEDSCENVTNGPALKSASAS